MNQLTYTSLIFSRWFVKKKWEKNIDFIVCELWEGQRLNANTQQQQILMTLFWAVKQWQSKCISWDLQMYIFKVQWAAYMCIHCILYIQNKGILCRVSLPRVKDKYIFNIQNANESLIYSHLIINYDS